MRNYQLLRIAQGKLIKHAVNLNLFDIYKGGMATMPLVMEPNPKLHAADEIRKKVLTYLGSKKQNQFTPLNF